MTTSQVEQAANRGHIADGDFNIGLVLRQSVIPTFLEDVGRLGWRLKFATIPTVAGTRTYPLPADFFEMAEAYIDGKQLGYIGEDHTAVMKCESGLVNTAVPAQAYYLTPDTVDQVTQLRLDVAPSSSGSLMVVYWWYIPFSGELDDVNLNDYVPEQYHFALVELLRREIMEDRYGQGDQRYQTADAKYQSWVQKISMKREQARRNNAVFVR